MPEEVNKDAMRTPATSDKATNSERPAATTVNIPLVNEVQLTAATGGAELSCYRCTVPFGVVVLIAGIVVTVVAYSFNSHGSTISYFGLVLLSAGLLLLASSAICWKVRMERKKERRRESQTVLVTNQRSIFSWFTGFGFRQLPPQNTKLWRRCWGLVLQMWSIWRAGNAARRKVSQLRRMTAASCSQQEVSH